MFVFTLDYVHKSEENSEHDINDRRFGAAERVLAARRSTHPSVLFAALSPSTLMPRVDCNSKHSRTW